MVFNFLLHEWKLKPLELLLVTHKHLKISLQWRSKLCIHIGCGWVCKFDLWQIFNFHEVPTSCLTRTKCSAQICCPKGNSNVVLAMHELRPLCSYVFTMSTRHTPHPLNFSQVKEHVPIPFVILYLCCISNLIIFFHNRDSSLIPNRSLPPWSNPFGEWLWIPLPPPPAQKRLQRIQVPSPGRNPQLRRLLTT